MQRTANLASKVEWLKSTFSPSILRDERRRKEALVDFAAKMDPSDGKYVVWIYRMLIATWSAEEIRESIDVFERVKKERMVPKELKDIDVFRSPNALMHSLKPFLLEERAPIKYEDENWVVRSPKDFKAMCLLGTEKWCVARPSQLHYYIDYQIAWPDSEFLVFENKKNGDKYCAFLRDNRVDEFVNKDDNNVPFSDPVWDVLHSIYDLESPRRKHLDSISDEEDESSDDFRPEARMNRVAEDQDFSAAGILLVRNNGKLGVDEYLLGKRSETIDEGGLWGTPGGGADKGEDPLETALREFEEELGSLPEDLQLEWTSNYEDKFMLYVCRTNDSDWRPDLEDASHGFETDNVAWFTLDELLSGEPRPEREEGHPSPWPLHFGVEAIFDRETEIEQVEEGIRLEAAVSEEEVRHDKANEIIEGGKDQLFYKISTSDKINNLLGVDFLPLGEPVVFVILWMGGGRSANLIAELIESLSVDDFILFAMSRNQRVVRFFKSLGAKFLEEEEEGGKMALRFRNKRPVPFEKGEESERTASVPTDPIEHTLNDEGYSGTIKSGENIITYDVSTKDATSVDFFGVRFNVKLPLVYIGWWGGKNSAALVAELIESLPWEDFILYAYPTNSLIAGMFRAYSGTMIKYKGREYGFLKFVNRRPVPFEEGEIEMSSELKTSGLLRKAVVALQDIQEAEEAVEDVEHSLFEDIEDESAQDALAVLEDVEWAIEEAEEMLIA